MATQDCKPLDALKLATDIQSHEGIGVDQMTRTRMSFLTAQHSMLLKQVQMADAKAGAILAVLGVFGAQMITSRISIDHVLYLPIILLSGIVVVLSLAVVVPRLVGRKDMSEMHEQDRYSFMSLVSGGYSAEDHAQFMRSSEASQLIMSVARTNAFVARILLTKFKLLRWAFVLSVVDMALILFAVGHGG